MGRLFAVSLAVFAFSLPSFASAEDSAKVKAMFANPPREYSTGPLWTWNDMLTEDHIRSTLRDLAGQKVKQVWVHPRPGMMTAYLSDDWFKLWKAALDEAKKLDMNVWIYDENSYPSGFAGGLVPEAMPESRGRGLAFREEKQPGKPGDDVLAIFRMTDDGYEDVTKKAREGKALPEADYLVAHVIRAKDSPWYAGRSYVDLLYPGVTEKFIEITFEAYRREIGDQFGKHCPGIFTDEPRLVSGGNWRDGNWTWTKHLPEEFQKRWGYSLMDHLPSLYKKVGDWRRVRHNYNQVLLEQFIEHWAKPTYEYCERHGLEFTGHYWEHAWPKTTYVPDNMAMYAWMQRPGIDILFNRYDDKGVNAQFGNIRSVKELGSVANQLGRKRTISETFGGSGWDTRFEDIKRQADWQYVLGLNTLNECLSFISIRGVRKGDYPQSLSYHEPWWNEYHVLEEYFTRLSLAMSSGEEVNRILLIEPTSTAWMYQGEDQLKPLGERFQAIVAAAAKAQVEFDIGCEDIMARHGSVEGTELIVGHRRYDTVVVPPLCENLNGKTMDLLEAYVKAGGVVLCCGPPPKLVDGKPSGRGQVVSNGSQWKRIDNDEELPTLLLGRSKDGFAVHPDEKSGGILFHQRRRLDDGELLFLVNTSITAPSFGWIVSKARGVEKWVLETGEVAATPFASSKEGITTGFEIPPCGSVLLFLSDEPRKETPVVPWTMAYVPASTEMKTRRIEPNVLTLDYVDVTVGGETLKGAYCRRASQLVFEKHGFKRNPWFHAIQFRDEHMQRKFPADSGFEATYRFTVKDEVPGDLQIVVERPDLYAITCNGQSVTAKEGQWWLDRSFGKIDISKAAKVGENELTLRARPFSVYHELEPAYLLGSFTLQPAESGFVVVADKPPKIAAKDKGGWNNQGHPFYAAGVAYSQEFKTPKPEGDYWVELPSWYGSVAKVIVNGKPAGHIAFQPWKCHVTEHIRPGINKINVLVIGTLKNTLGPHHAGEVRGFASPHIFEKAPAAGPPPGEKYDTIGYGLFEPFVLQQVTTDGSAAE